jgi:hypothetical protein
LLTPFTRLEVTLIDESLPPKVLPPLPVDVFRLVNRVAVMLLDVGSPPVVASVRERMSVLSFGVPDGEKSRETYSVFDPVTTLEISTARVSVPYAALAVKAPVGVEVLALTAVAVVAPRCATNTPPVPSPVTPWPDT